MTTPYRILFVCMGNICRSPAAEGVLRHMVREEGLEGRIEVDSAGTLGYHAGSSPDQRMRQTAAGRGIYLSGKARPIAAADLESFDLVVTMDEDNFVNVGRLDLEQRYATKIRRFCEFCRDHDDTEVPDPYYGGGAGFEHVMDLLLDGCVHIKEYALRELAARDAS